jgi:hypothetical protein
MPRASNALVRVGAGKHSKHTAPRYASCRASKVFRGLKPGTYILYVRAVWPGGVEAQPMTRRFRLA